MHGSCWLLVAAATPFKQEPTERKQCNGIANGTAWTLHTLVALLLDVLAATIIESYRYPPRLTHHDTLSAALLGVLAATIVEFHKVDPTAAYLLVPYFAWSSFATVRVWIRAITLIMGLDVQPFGCLAWMGRGLDLFRAGRAS